MGWGGPQDFAEHLDGLMAAGDALNGTRFSVQGLDSRGAPPLRGPTDPRMILSAAAGSLADRCSLPQSFVE